VQDVSQGALQDASQGAFGKGNAGGASFKESCEASYIVSFLRMFISEI